jgi:hypothetical protein
MTDPAFERVSNEPAITSIIIYPGAPMLYVLREDHEDVTALLRGERDMVRDQGEPDVRRVLDFGAREGAFAVHCRLRWPYAWVDSVEPDQRLKRLCEANAPPGARVFDAVPTDEKYDLVRITKNGLAHVYMGNALGIATATKQTQILFCDGFVAPQPPEGFEIVATGMRRKHEPFSWWVRK